MTDQQLNSLAENYRLNGCQQSYNELYNAVSGLRTINRRSMRRMGFTDISDADTVFDDTFMRVISREVTDNFQRFLSRSLKHARIDFDRKEQRRRSNEASMDAPTSSDPDAPTLGMTLLSDYDTEAEAIAKKKKAEQRQLLDFLLMGSDSLTKEIVRRFPEYDSANALAKALGVHHSVISRKLKSLARKYDANRYGDIADYLAI